MSVFQIFSKLEGCRRQSACVAVRLIAKTLPRNHPPSFSPWHAILRVAQCGRLLQRRLRCLLLCGMMRRRLLRCVLRRLLGCLLGCLLGRLLRLLIHGKPGQALA